MHASSYVSPGESVLYERVFKDPVRPWGLRDLQTLFFFVAWIDFMLLVGIVSLRIDSVFRMVDGSIDPLSQNSDLMLFGVLPVVFLYHMLMSLSHVSGIFNNFDKVMGIAIARWHDLFKLFVNAMLLHLVMQDASREGCNPGRYLDYGQCQPCAMASFKGSFGEEGCQRCPYNLSSLPGSLDCRPCHELYNAGYIYEESDGTCFKFITEDSCPRYMTFTDGLVLGKLSDCKPNCDRFFMGQDGHTMWYYLDGQCLFIPDQGSCTNVTRCPQGQTSDPYSSSAEECFSV